MTVNTQDTPRNAPYGPGGPGFTYSSPDGRRVNVNTTLGVLFADDFGGLALNSPTPKWDIYDGGLGAVTLSDGTAQAAIGSGIAMGSGGNVASNTAFAVANSILTVTMGTTANAELWMLSKQIFGGAEDLTVVLSKSQALAANGIFVGMVEVDPSSGYPLLNPNLANDFFNRGGVEFGKTATNTQAQVECVADASGSLTTNPNASFAPAAMTTAFETTIEYHPEDVIASSAVADGTSGKTVNVMRVSSQVPNDQKAYKLLVKFKNIGTPGSSTTVSLSRILVVDGHEMRVEIASGRGDTIAQKAIAANVVNPISNPVAAALQASGNVMGALSMSAAIGAVGNNNFKLISAATTNAQSIKTSQGRIYNGAIANTVASWRYLKFYNKASAPTVGTDTPVWTVGLPPNTTLGLNQLVGDVGMLFGTGIALAITANAADSDTTAIAANDVVLDIGYA